MRCLQAPKEKKCREDCVLAPYFPSRKAREYHAVHRVFGFSNVVKMLSNLDDHQGKKEAVDSLQWEAFMWSQDPVHGPLGAYKKACNVIKNLLMIQQTQTAIPNYETRLMTQVSNNDSSETNNNWVLAVPNNVNVAAPPLVANSILQNPNSYGSSIHPAQAFLQRSSPWQPNYLPSLVDVADQQGQIRGFQLQRGLQGTEGSFENINSGGQEHGRGLVQSSKAGQAQQELAAAIPLDIMQWHRPQ